jgi:hypothetical protein
LIVETKGRIDIEDAPKWRRLVQWCEDATKGGEIVYRPLFVPETDWKTSHFASFAEAAAAFSKDPTRPEWRDERNHVRIM